MARAHEDLHQHGTALRTMAATATLHCLTGCAIGEVLGLVIATAAGLGNLPGAVLSIALAFVFGYTLSSLPLLRTGLLFSAVAAVVLASDTVSIVTMEVVDTLIELTVPGATSAGLDNTTFWWSTLLALSTAFVAAYPVNLLLLRRGRGHAHTHQAYATAPAEVARWRRRIPVPPPTALAAVTVTFLLGGLLAAAG